MQLWSALCSAGEGFMYSRLKHVIFDCEYHVDLESFLSFPLRLCDIVFGSRHEQESTLYIVMEPRRGKVLARRKGCVFFLRAWKTTVSSKIENTKNKQWEPQFLELEPLTNGGSPWPLTIPYRLCNSWTGAKVVFWIHAHIHNILHCHLDVRLILYHLIASYHHIVSFFCTPLFADAIYWYLPVTTDLKSEQARHRGWLHTLTPDDPRLTSF